MHGATIYSISHARSIESMMDKPFFNYIRPNFGQLFSLFCFVFQLQECALVSFYGIPSMLGTFCFHRHGVCLEANASMRTDAWTG